MLREILARLFAASVDQFDIENQRGESWDFWRASICAIGEIVWNVKFVESAFFHQLNALRPPGNDIAERKTTRLTAVVGANGWALNAPNVLAILESQ